MSAGDPMYQYRQFLGCPLTHYQILPTFAPSLTKPPADNECQPFDTVGRILELEKQVAELRALVKGRE